MFDFTVGQIVVLASLSAILLGRREMKAAAFYAGKFTGHTVGMLRRYRARLQAVIQEADVPVQSLQDDLHKSMSEVQSIRDELSALTNFSPQMLQHGKFDLREEELHSPPVFVDDGRSAQRRAAGASAAASEDATVQRTWDGPNPGPAASPASAAGATATTATMQAGGAARRAPMDPLDALLASAFTPPRAAQPVAPAVPPASALDPAAGAGGGVSGTPHAQAAQAPAGRAQQHEAPSGSQGRGHAARAATRPPAAAAGAAAGSAVSPAAPSWATDAQYTTPLDKYSEFTNKTDRVPGGADLVLQSVSDRKWLHEYAHQQAQAKAPSAFDDDDETGRR